MCRTLAPTTVPACCRYPGIDYRDFRPSVQLACQVFFKARAYQEAGRYDDLCNLLGLVATEAMPAMAKGQVYPDGGYAMMSAGSARVLFKYPRYQFRPSQCDALHLDLWVDGQNKLIDGGSYSYNAGEQWLNYFHGTQAHNTVGFDDREQMPKLSRFLYGQWLDGKSHDRIADKDAGQSFEAGYTDHLGATHYREVSLGEQAMTVTDNVKGFNNKAVLRWRLAPSDYVLDGQTLSGQWLAP